MWRQLGNAMLHAQTSYLASCGSFILGGCRVASAQMTCWYSSKVGILMRQYALPKVQQILWESHSPGGVPHGVEEDPHPRLCCSLEHSSGF